ncbi:MAG: BlaI/MecI/CopY family transcriptional regulator [Ruminococcaceae bacterium]|nr:BlaI/MecI/CopY family transcriptional regulator [Oscillospiraceae bacterium]
MDRKLTVTHTEWSIMELLWEEPRTLMELVNTLGKTVGWSKSTVTTMVRRMTEKELIAYDTDGRTKLFRPAVDREDVVAQETDSLLDRAYRGSLGLMLSTLVNHKHLSKADIDELYAILRQAEEEAE